MTPNRFCAVVAAGLLTAATAQASTAPTGPAPIYSYDTLGGAENGGDSFASAGPTLVDGILTSDQHSTLTAVTLNVELQHRDLGSFDVILGNVGPMGQPVSVRLLGTISDSMLTRQFKRIRLTLRTPLGLALKTHYYVGIRKHNGAKSTVVLGNTVDPAVLSRGEVKAGAYYYNNGGQQANAGGPYEMIVLLE